VRVGVAHHSFRTVHKHQPGTSFGPDQPPVTGCAGWQLRDQRIEQFLVGGQLNQKPTDPVHVEDISRTKIIEPIRKMAERPGQGTGTRLPAGTCSVARNWIMGRHCLPPSR
jgi:hypothetical protein